MTSQFGGFFVFPRQVLNCCEGGMMQKDLTQGNILKTLIGFSIPYLISCFLQTFYGLTDLFVAGRFNHAEVISAVSIGSQVMHMLTVMIVGLAMGSTVLISNAVGAKDSRKTAEGIGNTVSLFLLFSVFATLLLLFCTDQIITLVATPPESLQQTKYYLLICFAGVPFITAYNIISGIFRGLGDSKSPLYFVAAAGVINILLDFLLIGGFRMQAPGAALATVLAQAASVFLALFTLRRRSLGVSLTRQDFRFHSKTLSAILKVGIPVSLQDGLIQVSFLAITAIANSRGVATAAAVGIVEKIISFLFLVPSAMLSSVSVMTAQSLGAGQHDRGKSALFYGIRICVLFGIFAALVCQFAAEPILGIFAHKEAGVIVLGSQYLRAYVWDCVFAGIHFCFSGYFCAYGKSMLSFLQNLISIILIRVPGAYFASKFFPDTLYPMGLAPPVGSFLSALICVGMYLWLRKSIKSE